ncbi:MAG TPA: hypothetical protein VKU85_05340 [bacterium]|nr:hypothetical protein [bacterium]
MTKSRALAAFLAVTVLLVSAPIASAAPLAISNVQTSFDPLACEVTVSWDTNKNTDTNQVKWDTVPCPLGPTYPNVENAGGGQSHSVTFSVAAAASPKISYIIESSKPGESAATSCAVRTSGPCISE